VALPYTITGARDAKWLPSGTPIYYTPEQPYSVIVWLDERGVAHARDGATGKIIAVSNDHAAVIQAALDSVPAGGAIFLKRGTYTLKSPIATEKQYVSIIGEGYNTVLFKAFSGDAITFNSKAANAVFANFTIDTDTGTTGHIIRFASGIVASRFLNVNVRNKGAGDCIRIEGTGSFEVAVAFSRLTALNGRALYARDVGELFVVGNKVFGNVALAYCDHATITGNGFEAVNLYITGSYNFRVVGNWWSRVPDTEYYAIFIENDDLYENINSVIAHNTIANLQAGKLGIRVNATTKNIKGLAIVGNKIAGSDATGIGIQKAGDYAVTGCVIADNDLQGFAGTKISGFDLAKNVVKRNIGFPTESSGASAFSGDGTKTQFAIAHGLVAAPSKVLVTPGSADARGAFHVTADAANIYVNYATPPPAGTNNVVLYWYAEV
jgi:hypothetical protein